MDLTQLKSNFKPFAVVIIVIALIVVGFALFWPKGQKAPSVTPSPPIAPNTIVPPQKEPQELPKTIQEIRKTILSKQIEDRSGDIILFENENYQIAYIPAPNVFFVTIYKDPATQFKQEAQNWFKDFGFKQEDLCDLPVRFVLGNFEIRKTNPTFTSLPDGCTGQPATKPQQ